jgi:serine protease Do
MSKTILSFSYLLIFIVISTLLSNCSSYQDVTFTSNSPENEVYLDNYLVLKGKSAVVKINTKNTYGQLTILRKGYKPAYDVFVRKSFQNGNSFESTININALTEDSKLPIKNENEKNIDFSNIKIDRDRFYYINVKHDGNLMENLAKRENEFFEERTKKREKLANEKLKENKGKQLDSSETLLNYRNDELKNDQLKIDEPKLENYFLKTLKETKYIDTVSKVFSNQNNTLFLDASIKKIITFNIKNSLGSNKFMMYFKNKLDITWYLKNSYGEVLDSIETVDYSGNFLSMSINILYVNGFNVNNHYYVSPKDFETTIADALSNSFLKITKNKTFIDNIKLSKDFLIKESKLTLNKIDVFNKVTNKSEAFKATVIVKAKENNKDAGHGSGFAISKDGYVLTNYHVIAGKYANKQNEISVITATGQELPAKIVRYNKFKDVALLKIDFNFEKVFDLESKNKAEVMMDVLTIGAPKSIELGQSVTAGIISNIRNENENKYLQLGMSINGGNSGGAIFDTQGNLHGIVVSKLVGYATEGVAFAIPSYMVAEYLNLEVK